jgi:hypothetical protein
LNFFPTPPTDNFYKFLAILGAWLMGAVVALFMLLGYFNYDIEKQSLAQTYHFQTTQKLEKIKRRQKSIELGNIQENIIDNARFSDGSHQEIKYLNDFESRLKIRIKEYNKVARTDYKKVFEVIKATGFMYFIYSLIAAAILCFWIGFKNWYFKVQKVNDELLGLDLKIKRLTLRELESKNKTSTRLKLRRRT